MADGQSFLCPIALRISKGDCASEVGLPFQEGRSEDCSASVARIKTDLILCTELPSELPESANRSIARRAQSSCFHHRAVAKSTLTNSAFS